jgi:hypothetical protein
VETATITGGTGRFAGATGSFTAERTFYVASGKTIGSSEGWISPPGQAQPGRGRGGSAPYVPAPASPLRGRRFGRQVQDALLLLIQVVKPSDAVKLSPKPS